MKKARRQMKTEKTENKIKQQTQELFIITII